ncbi:MAG: adenylate/guanylate cyclase domain-containing protein [Chloroflexi bacterium]|nr:adenylate/guanylate cyclase domain-containing protein [Chloroflexota bacterium]
MSRAIPLPSGTVTFFFTDIEGSTKLWEQLPEAMHRALALHDRLLVETIEAHGGAVFKTVGDAVYAAFATAPAALAAVLAAQRALDHERWETILGPDRHIRVRMALHTGTAHERGGDYFGPSLNRVARLLAAGHGGQVLLSLTTEELVRDGLPEDVSLRDLGERRLKDLVRPERIFQVVASDLPATFPPLRTLDARPNNLPLQPTPLIGRQQELAEVRTRLLERGTRLLTLTGPGGTGKTRLSLQVAAEAIDDFTHGVYFVPLAAIRDPDLVAPAIAQALALREEAGRPMAETVRAFLADRHLLLVLDNLEQVLNAAPLVGDLLVACPHLHMLTTSRSVLGVYGEQELAIPPLPVPPPSGVPLLERLAACDSVRLFVERAMDARGDFALTSENTPAVAEICRRLDGLPLTIELAAARVKVLSPQAMLPLLDRRLDLLTTGARNRPPRQQTLRSLIDWSYDLLDADEQALFRRLGVFAGGCTLEAADAVCSVPSPTSNAQRPRFQAPSGEAADIGPGTRNWGLNVLDGITSLVEKSLLRQEDGANGAARFVMLETIREYALERLDTSGGPGEAEAVRRAHAECYLSLAEAALPALYGAEQDTWLERLEDEHDNLRAALRYWEAQRLVGRALRLAGSLAAFWRSHGHVQEGRAHLERLTQIAGPDVSTPAHAQALNAAGTLAGTQGDDAAALVHFERSLAIWRALGNRRRAAGLALNIGYLALRRGDLPAARRWFEGSLATARELDNRQGVANSLHNLAYLALVEGEYLHAGALAEECLRLQRELGNTKGIAGALGNLAAAATELGDVAAAGRYIAEGLSIWQALGSGLGVAQALEDAAAMAVLRQQPERAVRLAHASTALRALADTPRSAPQQRRLDGWLELARRSLDEPAWVAAERAGDAMTMDEAVDYALGGLETPRSESLAA